MRFDLTPVNTVGDTKVVTKFLWFPLTIGMERRWFERAKIKYDYYEVKDPTSGGCFYWRALKFLNN